MNLILQIAISQTQIEVQSYKFGGESKSSARSKHECIMHPFDGDGVRRPMSERARATMMGSVVVALRERGGGLEREERR